MVPRALVLALLVASAAACGADLPPAVVVATPPPPPPPTVSASDQAQAVAAKNAPAKEEAREAKIARELNALDAQVVAGDVPTGLLDGPAAAGVGAGASGVAGLRLGDAGGGPVQPGKGGSLTALGGPSTGAAKGPVASATVGRAAVSGGAVDNAADVVAGMTAGFRRCLNRALADAPNSVANGGKLVVTAKLDANGAVVSATPSKVTGVPPSAVNCVVARVTAAQFAAPGGAGATIVIPVTAGVQ